MHRQFGWCLFSFVFAFLINITSFNWSICTLYTAHCTHYRVLVCTSDYIVCGQIHTESSYDPRAEWIFLTLSFSSTFLFLCCANGKLNKFNEKIATVWYPRFVPYLAGTRKMKIWWVAHFSLRVITFHRYSIKQFEYFGFELWDFYQEIFFSSLAIRLLRAYRCNVQLH